MRRLDAPLTIREVADLFSRDYRQVRTMLLRRDEELRGTLLTKRGSGCRTRYTVTHAALRRAFPDAYDELVPAKDRMGELDKRVRELFSRVMRLAHLFGEHEKQLHKLAKGYQMGGT